jgi:thioredoxin reductase (NADPH)
MTIMKTDVILIGTGPVGLFAIFQCGMMGLKCHAIDALDTIGGQCAALYPEKPIYDIPAYPAITGSELIENLHSQCKPFHPVFHLGQRVEEVQSLADKSWHVTTSKGHVIEGKVIIIAAGVGAFGPNRPPLSGIETYEGHSVFYYVKNREAFRDKRIVIAGGGDSALDWAVSLSEIAQKVYLVHRRSKFRGAPETLCQVQGKVEQKQIELVVPYQLSALEGDGMQLSGVQVQTLEGESRLLETDILLPFFGLSTQLGPINSWGLDLHKNHIAVNGYTQETNVPGIYAIGDVATYDHKLKLILTGFAEGAQAAHQARRYIYPQEAWHFEHSTTQGIPGLKEQQKNKEDVA